jgi:hypothetical protein
VTISFVDRCIFQANAIGLGDFIVSGAVLGYITPAQANAVNGATYHYIAETRDTLSNVQQWEIGTGNYNSATLTLARTTIVFSSSANAKVNFIKAPQVLITYLAEDVVTGPTSSTANHAAIFGDTTGKNLIDSNLTLTPPATGATLTIADGKTLTANSSLTLAGTDGKSLTISNSFTFQGTDGSTINFGTGGTVLYTNPLLIPKTTPAGAAPGAGFASIQAVAGSIAGTCKIIIYAGTSATPITIVDNVGSGF